MWKYTGDHRPDFALVPGSGQESVWDYPRPPALVECTKLIEVKHGGKLLARTGRSMRVLETASPPTFYIPPEDVDFAQLVTLSGFSMCEWKGAATYWGLAGHPEGTAVAWSYPSPKAAFSAIRGWLCFYPGRVECTVNDERVRPQEGGFYGGWITDDIVGPWKGAPGTSHW